MKERLCVALDVENAEKARHLVTQLKDYVGYFKIGFQLFTSEGPNIVREVTSLGGKVFLDLKYHDIPNTVASAAVEAVKIGASIINLHASGGYDMMKATADKVSETSYNLKLPKPIVLAVTVLTSLNKQMLNEELMVQGDVERQVVHLARLAQEAGLDGVVASPLETKSIRSSCGPDFVIMTPGIRPAWSVADDQKRITTPKKAIDDGANILVIGRPITGASDPADAAKKVLIEMQG